MGRARALTIALAAVLAATLALASTASASDPGRWILTGASSVPDNYWQGLTSDPSDSQLFFIGPSQGLWQTTPQLVQTAGVDKAIPTALKQSVGYNHIGDPTWLDGEGGRVVLPMECYNPAQDPSNTCGKGAFGIADPQTLAFRYYVQLDPKFIPKAMWAETSPNGKLIWTSVGQRPDRLSRQPGDSGERRPVRPAAQAGQDAHGAVPPERRHRRRLPARPAARRRLESNHDVRGVGGEHEDRRPQAEARAALLRRVRGPRPLLRPRRPPALDHRPVGRLRLHAHLRPDERNTHFRASPGASSATT